MLYVSFSYIKSLKMKVVFSGNRHLYIHKEQVRLYGGSCIVPSLLSAQERHEIRWDIRNQGLISECRRI